VKEKNDDMTHEDNSWTTKLPVIIIGGVIIAIVVGGLIMIGYLIKTFFFI